MDFYRWKKKSGDIDGMEGSLKCHIKQRRETYYQLHIFDFQIWGIDSNNFSLFCAYEQILNSIVHEKLLSITMTSDGD